MQSNNGPTPGLAAAAGSTGSVPYFVDGDGAASILVAISRAERNNTPETAGPIGDALQYWIGQSEDSRKKIGTALSGGSAAPSPHWQRPLDPHAKILMIGGHRNADPPAQAAGHPPALLKFPTAFAHPGDALQLPRSGGRFEIDVAVGFVIGRAGARMSAAKAASAVAGYVLLADVTQAEDYEEEARTNNGLRAKNHPGLSPISPFIALAHDDNHVPNFDIWLKVNGAEQQAVSTSEFLWSPGEAVAAWSLSTYVAGDVVALGAAAARHRIPPVSISDGDDIEIGCSLLGKVRHKVATRLSAAVGP